MKTKRSVTIYIEKPGDRREPFDVSKYLQLVIKEQNLRLNFYDDGTTLDVMASWHVNPPLRVLLHHCRVVVRIYAKALYQKVVTILSGIGLSKR